MSTPQKFPRVLREDSDKKYRIVVNSIILRGEDKLGYKFSVERNAGKDAMEQDKWDLEWSVETTDDFVIRSSFGCSDCQTPRMDIVITYFALLLKGKKAL